MPLPPIESIKTPRLSIRPVTEADLGDLLEVNGDGVVTQHLPYATWASLADGAAWLGRMRTLSESGGARQLVIERDARPDAARKVIGAILVFKFDEGSSRVELGYVLGRANWRQGLAREAVVATCDHLFRELWIRRIEAEVNPANVASNQLLLNIGFVHEGLLRQRWTAKGNTYDTNIYGCLADEWLQGEKARANFA
jgi:ribosomal-protein-alanine N-acetyltransferase